MKTLLHSLRTFAPVTDVLEQGLYQIVTNGDHKKNNFFLKAGEVNRHIWYIEKGLVIIYRESGDGIKVTWTLKEGDYIIATDSFSTSCPTGYNILALENTVTWLTSRTDLLATCQKCPEFWGHYTAIEGRYRKIGETFNAMTPKERFDDLWDNKRDLFYRVKKEWLASYIGMSLKTFDEYKKGKQL